MKGIGKRVLQVIVILAGTAIMIMVAWTAPEMPEEAEEKEIIILEEQVVEVVPDNVQSQKPQTRIFTLCEVPLEDDFQVWLKDLCMEYDVDYRIMVAMMQKESNFNPQAVGKQGELGLLQIKSGTAKEAEAELGRRVNLFKPEDNATAAVVLMSKYIKKYGTEEKALMAYNMGPSGARRLWKKGVTESEYAVSILQLAAGYKEKNYVIVQVSGDV